MGGNDLIINELLEYGCRLEALDINDELQLMFDSPANSATIQNCIMILGMYQKAQQN